jgi:hypothetical protein
MPPRFEPHHLLSTSFGIIGRLAVYNSKMLAIPKHLNIFQLHAPLNIFRLQSLDSFETMIISNQCVFYSEDLARVFF